MQEEEIFTRREEVEMIPEEDNSIENIIEETTRDIEVSQEI